MASMLTDTATRAVEQTREAARRLRDALPGEAGGPAVNLGLAERIGSGVIGAALVAVGVMLLGRRRSLPGSIALAATGAILAWRGTTGHCPAYQALGVEAEDASAVSHPLGRSIHVVHRVRIQRSAAELYACWRDLKNLPRIMPHLQKVEPLGDGWSRWTVTAPRGRTVQWDARITEEQPNALIAWRSTDDADVPNDGHVRFESSPHGHGTMLEVDLRYRPPAGVIGALVARFSGTAPARQVREDLRRFKQVMEAGEIPTTAGQARGNCG